MEKEIMVKVCDKCGIVNSERAEKCESCGAKLGAPVKNSEADKLNEKITERNEKTKRTIAAEKFGGTDEETPKIPLTPSRIIIGVIGGLVAVGMIVLMVINGLTNHEFAYELSMADLGGLLLIGIGLLYCLLPSYMWAFSHAFYWMHYKEMPEPSDIQLVMEQVVSAMLILIGAATGGYNLYVLCNTI